ncbi:MAG TPA: nuclear transport factor 2 family protein [Bryobacteraceae bacterium]|jgi:prepilin-type processing-associated H-X9-DG protein
MLPQTSYTLLIGQVSQLFTMVFLIQSVASVLMNTSRHEAVHTALQRINSLWLDGHVEGLEALVDPNIVMVLPGFTGRIQGRQEFLAGFRDFCENVHVHEFTDRDYGIDIFGDTAVISFGYEMVYERSSERYRATGRDLWIFQAQDSGWVAVWRAMLDMQEERV